MKDNEILDFTRNVFCLKHKINEKIGKEFNLAPIEVDILTFVYLRGEKVCATHIEKERNLKKNTISIHVENLVKLGYLQRKESCDDKRTIYLSLLKKSISVAQRTIKESDNLKRQLLKGFEKEDLKILENYFKLINKNAINLLNK